MAIPFTYIITHVPTNVKYYGARWAKGCNPKDLGTTYFSSSNFMKKIIKEEGLDKFKFEVRKTFSSAEEAIKWETKFLTKIDAAKSPYWFNKHNNQGTPKFVNEGGYKLSERAKQNMRKPKSLQHKEKLVENLNKNRVIPEWTEDRKITQSESMKNEKNHNFGKSDHPGALVLKQFSLERKNKSLEEIYGYEKAKEIRFKSGNCRGKKKHLSEVTCPWCGKIGKGPNMTRYHFHNCKLIQP
jgi:ribosomal protein L39E